MAWAKNSLYKIGSVLSPFLQGFGFVYFVAHFSLCWKEILTLVGLSVCKYDFKRGVCVWNTHEMYRNGPLPSCLTCRGNGGIVATKAEMWDGLEYAPEKDWVEERPVKSYSL